MSEEVKDIVLEEDRDVILAKLVIKGDTSSLKPREKVQYYNDYCHALGLNPLTRPFEFIKLQGREQLYATKSATEQLRKRDKISVFDMSQSQVKDVFIVTVKVRNAEGREDLGSGALKMSDADTGDDLANLIMKAETKAKRRATLSICGLGVIDETELETVSAQYVTEDELDKGRAAILQLFEDNKLDFDEDYVTSTIDDVDYAIKQRDITGLETMYAEAMKVLKKARTPEARNATKENFAEVAKQRANEKKSTKGPRQQVEEYADKKYNQEPHLPDSQGDLEIF